MANIAAVMPMGGISGWKHHPILSWMNRAMSMVEPSPHDIGDRKRNEEERRASEETLRVISDAAYSTA